MSPARPVTCLHSIFRDDPLRDFYNLDGLTDVVLTTDIDWAPDYASETVFALAERYGFKITAFATHDSALLKHPPDAVEVGLHPDYSRPDPKHGFAEKIAALKDLYPTAVGARCHRNFFGQNVANQMHDAGLVYDASSILWNQPLCQGHVDYNGMVRFSYCWEDGLHCDTGLPFDLAQLKLDVPGLKILNVHPIVIYLNAPNDDFRRAVTGRYRSLAEAPESDLAPEIYNGYGMRRFWEDLLAFLRDRNVRSHHLRDLAAVALGRPRR